MTQTHFQSPPPHELLELRFGNAKVSLAPSIGGSIVSYSEEHANGIVHWLRPTSSQALSAGDPLGMASFPLVPFCNRIRDGRFEIEGLHTSLAPNYQTSPHPLHGNGWENVWRIKDATTESATLCFEYAQDSWPYPFQAEQTFMLDELGLHVCMKVTNTGPNAMPLGLGHHPYFPYEPGTIVSADVDAIWCRDDENMPTKLDWKHDVVAALRTGMPVQQFSLDNNFIGWNRTASIIWPDGHNLKIVADAPLDYLVLVTPKGESFFCVEPVSNCTDWINLRNSHPSEHRGGTMLAAGETLSTSFSLITSLMG